MNIDLFYKLLALILINKLKTPQNRVTSILREPFPIHNPSNLSFIDANNLLEKHALSLPTLTANDWSFAHKIYEDNISNGIEILSINQDIYPRYLKVIKDAPPLLFVKGNLNIFQNLPGVAVVGARDASSTGIEVSRRLSRFLVKNNWVVVSGLATGIDESAHRGALEDNGQTIAVLAGGLDKPTPARNAKLGYDILENDGAWVSEHSFGIPTLKHHFVPRNRIQIGLSAGSIIVEAKIKSGSLSQARFCVGQNRPLFAVTPQTLDNPLGLNCEGTLHMVSELGAIPLKSKSDYTKLLEMLSKERDMII
ncbi:DNA-processing protein DprA [Thalassotalea hakodatensis]|uniref:DNA-processing protein DprA n=1 Tax=Thalassotalea hakodatensis TaxID=3030492 RepID=UPI0025723A90|nr:DNA-processing protein DprA [Thalassotalea hakodatensis]